MININKLDWNDVIAALKENEGNTVYKVSAKSVLIPGRLDTVIRELALKELIDGSHGVGVDLYRRWLALSHGIREATRTNPAVAYFSDYSEKTGFEQYCHSLLCLYESIGRNGFDPKYFIPIDSEGNPINGMHRLAVAVHLGMDVYVKNYTNVRTGWVWSCSRLAASHFSEGELLMIIKRYAELKTQIPR